jgi:hypothetical protein
MCQAFSSSASILAARAGRPSRSRVQGDVGQAQGVGAFLVGADLGALLQSGDALFQAFQVGQHQFHLDDLEIAERVDAALDVDDVAVLEAAGHEGHGVAVADVGQELVAQALALAGAAHQAGDVDEGDPGRDDLLGAGDLGQGVQARLGHGHFAGVRLDGAERIVGGLGRRRLGQGVEQGGLADIGQADDGDFKGHGSLVNFVGARLARIAREVPSDPTAGWHRGWPEAYVKNQHMNLLFEVQ